MAGAPVQPPGPPPGPDIEAIQGLSGNDESSFVSEMFYGAFANEEVLGTVTPAGAVGSVQALEAQTQATRRLFAMLEAANIDVQNPITQEWISLMSGGAEGEDGAKAALAILTGPGGGLALADFLTKFPEAALVQATPYSQALEANAFTTDLAPQQIGEMQQKAMMSGIPPSQFPSTAATGRYEYSNTTGAIRFANGTIVTEGGGIIFDPTKNAPGSDAYLRAAADWDAAKLAEWKDKLVAYGYLTKEQAKGDGLTIEVRNALQSYWYGYYNNGGKPIASDAASGGGVTLNDPIDYAQYSAEARNNMRQQLHDILGIDPTEEQVTAQAQYVIREASRLQTLFRKKGNRGNLGTQYDQATEQAIGNIETSPYAQDVRENTALRDAMQNAAYVSRGLLS